METKKTPQADLEKRRPLFMQIGLVAALAITLVAFEWTTYETTEFALGELTVDLEEEEMVPITQREVTPPPPPEKPVKIEVVDDNTDVPDIPLELVEFKIDEPIEFTPVEEPIEDEPDIFTVVEQMPSFKGGEKSLMRFLAENVKYPAMAKDAGIEGTVYINFIIDEEGNIAHAKVLRGVGGGCDEEALRVVNKMPNWTPGKQRGKAVKVSFNLPVKFTLR